MTNEARILTPHERAMLAPYIDGYVAAERALKAAVALLAGEAQRGWAFDAAAGRFIPPEAEDVPGGDVPGLSDRAGG